MWPVMQSPPRQCDYIVQRRMESLEEMDRFWRRYINSIAQQRTWSAVRKLYCWVCKRVADALKSRLPQIKVSISNQDPAYDKLTQQDLEEIRSCTTVDGIMQIVGISKQWVDVSYLDEFYYDMADPLEPSIAELYIDRYKQLVQYMCCRVLLREAPDELLQELLQGVETNLESNGVLALIHDLDYKHFNAAQLLNEKECLKKLLNVPPGRLNCLHVEDGHSVAINWFINKLYMARIMFDGRCIFWPLLEHQVTSLELVGSLKLCLKGRHVPYMIRDALLCGQDLIQQTEVINALCLPHAAKMQ